MASQQFEDQVVRLSEQMRAGNLSFDEYLKRVQELREQMPAPFKFDHEVARTLLESTKGQNPLGNITVRVADLAHIAEAALQFAPSVSTPQPDKLETPPLPRAPREPKEPKKEGPQ